MEEVVKQWVAEESIMATEEKMMPSKAQHIITYTHAYYVGAAVPVWKKEYFQCICLYSQMR